MPLLLGVLTGISYQSGIDYYEKINRRYGIVKKKDGILFPPNPFMMMMSVDCDRYASYLVNREYEKVSTYLADKTKRLVDAGVDTLVIASNTGHIAFPEIQKRFPALNVLHIADCTAKQILKKGGGGIRKIGLLGTEPTMRESYLKSRLSLHGIETIVPEKEDDLKSIFQYIMHELGHGVFRDATRAFFLNQIRQLVARGAQGIVLGCTEIELLVQQEHLGSVEKGAVPLFPSAELHINAAIEILVEERRFESFLPSSNDPVPPLASKTP